MEKENQGTMKKKQFAKLEKQTNEKLKKAFEDTNHTLINNESRRKFSEIFISFMKPQIDLLREEEQVKKIFDWGVFIWNMAVADDFPEHSHSKTINVLFPLFKATSKDKDLVNKFILRKKIEFSNDNFFIAHYETQFDKKGYMSLSVAVLEIEK